MGDKSAVVFTAPSGRVANLTVRQKDATQGAVVEIMRGKLTLEKCDISGNGAVCVVIHKHADPTLRQNLIHHGKGAGVAVLRNGHATLEDNDIVDVVGSGVLAMPDSQITLRRNKITRNRAYGIWIHEGGGIFEDNDLRGNGLGAWRISAVSETHVKRSRNHDD